MIEYCDGDILQADVEVLCNPVNCQGIMGKGLALQFKRAYPEMFIQYQLVCIAGLLKPGRVHVYALSGRRNPRFVYNVATKASYSVVSNMDDVTRGISWIVDLMRQQKITSIAIPALGCGEGKLRWTEVSRLIERMMWPVKSARIVLYPPHGGTEA